MKVPVNLTVRVVIDLKIESDDERIEENDRPITLPSASEVQEDMLSRLQDALAQMVRRDAFIDEYFAVDGYIDYFEVTLNEVQP